MPKEKKVKCEKCGSENIEFRGSFFPNGRAGNGEVVCWDCGHSKVIKKEK